MLIYVTDLCESFSPERASVRDRIRDHEGGAVLSDHNIDNAVTWCENEPIHIPGSIQPHGYMIGIRESDLSVLHVSANVVELLQADIDTILGKSLAWHFGSSFARTVVNALEQEILADANPTLLAVSGKAFDGILSRGQGLVLLELEPHQEDPATSQMLARAIRRLQAAPDIDALKQLAVTELQNITGYDRVILYRFGPEGDGEVWAEARVKDLNPFLGLRFPASDIPKQARELYLMNWIRLIPNSTYTPVPIVPDLHSETGRPLDLTHSVLRSVSPVHLEYMRNMGLGASMSISLIQKGELWGLISCGHTQPKSAAYEVRQACQAIGQLLSVQIEAFEQRERRDSLNKRRPVGRALLAAVSSAHADSTLLGLTQRPKDLLALPDASGAAIVVGSQVTAIGNCPTHDVIAELSRELFAQDCPEGLYASDHAGGLGLRAEVSRTVSGILAIWLPCSDLNMVIWFRPEKVHTVNWAGAPCKTGQIQDGALRLSPRKSFDLWKQEARGRAHPWSSVEVELISELRRALVEIDLGRQVEAQKKAVMARDELVAVVSHDLRSPLMTISLQAATLKRDLLRSSAGSTAKLDLAVDRIGAAAQRMSSLLTDLLDLSLIEGGRIQLNLTTHTVDSVLDDAHSLLSPLTEEKKIGFSCHCEPGINVAVDKDRMFQVFSNLMGNAVKFTPAFGLIEIRAERAGKYVQVTVSDTGRGIEPEMVNSIFDRYWQARPGHSLGAGLGLSITKGIVEAHGGAIWVESHVGAGTAFFFTIPILET